MKETDSVENTKTKFRKKWNGEIYHQSQNTNVWAIWKYLLHSNNANFEVPDALNWHGIS